MNVCAFKAVVGTDGKVHILDCHCKNFSLLVILVFNKNIKPFDCIRKVFNDMPGKLGRTAEQREALLRNQASELLWYGKITTTKAKARR
mgnify:CR=1 FL=1